MKISIIGPGEAPIPPIAGSFAIESLIWDYKTILETVGFEVQVVNCKDRQGIINQVNEFNPQFIHIQWDYFVDLANKFNCKKVATTSHYCYINSFTKTDGFYGRVCSDYVNTDTYVFALTNLIRDKLIQCGCNPNKCFITPNGARSDLIKFSEFPSKADRSICLARIDPRKRQHLFFGLKSQIDCVGDIEHARQPNNWLGAWNKEQVHSNLTDYSNSILLSNGEAHSLSIVESLMAGLGVVVSEAASANLDLSRKFITVIKESMIGDREYLDYEIEKNKEHSLLHRKEIRQYAIDNFDWYKLVDNYCILIKKIVNNEI